VNGELYAAPAPGLASPTRHGKKKAPLSRHKLCEIGQVGLGTLASSR
jgi:hypothetical protein